MIKDVDRSEVISSHLIASPVLGPISVKEISGGVKMLILLTFDQSGKVFNADLTINLRHLMDFGAGEFEIRILNTGDIVHNMEEFIKIAGNYV